MSAAPQIRTALMANLKELHLPAMRECFEQAAQQAEKETLSYEQYLLQLTQRECESRRLSSCTCCRRSWHRSRLSRSYKPRTVAHRFRLRRDGCRYPRRTKRDSQVGQCLCAPYAQAPLQSAR